jgi:hypothetical protein
MTVELERAPLLPPHLLYLPWRSSSLIIDIFLTSPLRISGLVVDLGDVKVRLVDKDGVHDVDLGKY